MRNVFYGTLCGVLVFVALSWATGGRTVKAAVLASPPEGRFEPIQLHPNSASEWSGILDTETGCVWAYASQTPPSSPKTSYEFYQSALGQHAFAIVNFDASEYVSPEITSTGGSSSTMPRSTTNYSKTIGELARVTGLCDRVRIQALEAAAAH